MNTRNKVGFLLAIAYLLGESDTERRPSKRRVHCSSYLGAVECKVIKRRRKKAKLARKARRRNR